MYLLSFENELTIGISNFAFAISQDQVTHDFWIKSKGVYLPAQIGSDEFQDRYESIYITLMRRTA